MQSDSSYSSVAPQVLAASALGVMADAPATPSQVEVSVVLLEDEEMLLAGETGSMPSITADVLAFLAESEEAACSPAGEEFAPGSSREVSTLLVGVEELLGLGDVASALELLRKAEECDPEDERLEAARERCASAQRALLEARLGDTRQVPLLKLRMAELMKLSLDARMGFLLSRIDGLLSYEALFSVSGMSRLETMRVLVQLLDQDIILTRGANGTREL